MTKKRMSSEVEIDLIAHFLFLAPLLLSSLGLCIQNFYVLPVSLRHSRLTITRYSEYKDLLPSTTAAWPRRSGHSTDLGAASPIFSLYGHLYGELDLLYRTQYHRFSLGPEND